MPEYLDWARARLVPWLSGTLGVELNLDMEYLRQAVADNLRSDSDIFKTLLPKITTGGMAIVGFFTTVLLMPVVLFYFLRDWHEIVHRIEELIPRGAQKIAAEIDRVLGEFLRGQLLVMLLMAAYYAAALWIAGLEYALPIGILSGLLVFVPYLGMLVGLALGTLAGFNQFEGLFGLAGVWIAFGIGQVLEVRHRVLSGVKDHRDLGRGWGAGVGRCVAVAAGHAHGRERQDVQRRRQGGRRGRPPGLRNEHPEQRHQREKPRAGRNAPPGRPLHRAFGNGRSAGMHLASCPLNHCERVGHGSGSGRGRGWHRGCCHPRRSVRAPAR